jgi:hypothetical protein
MYDPSVVRVDFGVARTVQEMEQAWVVGRVEVRCSGVVFEEGPM